VTPFNPLRFEPHLGVEHVPGVAESHPSQTGEQVRERLEQSWRLVEEEKEFIKARILGRSNEELVRDSDPTVMAELKALGSDLNINAFVCNFRVKVPKASGNEKKEKGAREVSKSGNLGEGEFQSMMRVVVSEAADPDEVACADQHARVVFVQALPTSVAIATSASASRQRRRRALGLM
jgi:hypothetical protein